MGSFPADVRVNTAVPFPAQVQGAGIVAITKVNGVWIVSVAPQNLGVQSPPTNPLNDQALVYDPITKTLILVPISNFGNTRAQRSIIGAGNLPIVASDGILNINAMTDLQIPLPLAASRGGIALTFKNLKTSVAQTILPTGADKIDGAGFVGIVPTGSVTLLPFNDGVNSGWGVA